jgi:hypothetical protein
MTTFPGSPRLLKGALVALTEASVPGTIIAFQYNPDTMTRRLEARSSGGGERGAASEVYRLTGPPKETITLSVEIDAADQLEMGDPVASTSGVYPTLSALEMLLYPVSASVIKNAALAQAGIIEIVPPEAPPLILVWGPQRVLPVRLTGFSITEEAYDPALNPIRAKVELSLQVLSYVDFDVTHPGYHIFLLHQEIKERLAKAQAASNVAALVGSLRIV